MKKDIIAVVILFLAIILSGCDASDKEERFSMMGRYLRSGDSHLIVGAEGQTNAIVMKNGTEQEDIFDSLHTGEKIRVTCDSVLESYPAQTTIFSCEVLEQGEREDIPESVVESLTALGWEITP